MKTVICRQCGTLSVGEVGAGCPDDDGVLIATDVHREYPRDPYLGHLFADKYAVVDRIGQGGFGTVYRAIQRPVEQTVALKVLRGRDDVERARARFEREAKAIARLRHSATVKLVDYGAHDDTLFMALEYVDGVQLRQLIRREGTLVPTRAAHIAIEILESLHEAHGKGVIHRDLKASNIMVVRTPFGQDAVKVLDFGIAKLLDTYLETVPRHRTEQGMTVGSPLYIAPEQARAKPVAQSDLYSVGVLLFEMLTGAPPFTGNNAVEVMTQHARAPRPELPHAPPALAAIVTQAMAIDPDDRFLDAAHMGWALQQFVGESAEAADTVNTGAPAGAIFETALDIHRVDLAADQTTDLMGALPSRAPEAEDESASAGWLPWAIAGAAAAALAVGVALWPAAPPAPPLAAAGPSAQSPATVRLGATPLKPSPPDAGALDVGAPDVPPAPARREIPESPEGFMLGALDALIDGDRDAAVEALRAAFEHPDADARNIRRRIRREARFRPLEALRGAPGLIRHFPILRKAKPAAPGSAVYKRL